jgi:hypothetical protein
MRSGTPDGFCSIPSATGGIARLACARLRELGKDVAAVLAEVGARPEQVNDDAIRLEVPKQIRILELASEELQDGLLGFHLARNFDFREIGLVYYVIASSERLADALLNGKRYCTIMNEGVRLNSEAGRSSGRNSARLCRCRQAVRPASDRVLAGDVGADLPASDRYQAGTAPFEDQTSA